MLMLVLLPLYAARVKEAMPQSLFDLEINLAGIKWVGWEEGFTLEKGIITCRNADAKERRGAGKMVVLNQTAPMPIRVSAECRSEAVSVGSFRDFSLYIDAIYQDGSNLWGQASPFSIGTHDWEKRQVVIIPLKPVKSMACWLLLRGYSGMAQFRNLRVFTSADGKNSCFDTVSVKSFKPYKGFIVRDVIAESNFESPEGGHVLGVEIVTSEERRGEATVNVARLRLPAGAKGDRILHVAYTLPLGAGWRPVPFYRNGKIADGYEYKESVITPCGINGQLGKLPFSAARDATSGRALGMELHTPAHGRCGYNFESKELFVAWDIALTPERPDVTLKALSFSFAPKWGMRAAFDKLYKLYPESFAVRVKKQGIWMAFAKISEVQGWQDFHFAIKEGSNELEWDNANGITSFRYTEPMTWWMHMKPKEPHTLEYAVELVRQKAAAGDKYAKSFLTSTFKDVLGNPPARFKDTPWCNGVVWSMNSMPGIPGEINDFKVKWNPDVFNKYYGKEAKAHCDGEYVDSSEGYVTDEQDFDRAHFASATTPLTYDLLTRKPSIYRGLIAYEYVAALERNMRASAKLMMANSTPYALWWLAPCLDVMGTETNWNPNGDWSPSSDGSLLFKRAMCGAKPFCFLQNTDFTKFGYEKVEKYMKRSLFYGMYPGFFSANASTGHYFKTPELYNRDRPLFKKYLPLCITAGEAGWKPVTLATTNAPEIFVERFGDNLFTVFNNGKQTAQATVIFEQSPATAVDLVDGKRVTLKGNTVTFALPSEDVALLRLTFKARANALVPRP